jgi:alkanesulfonate monooxygenase SsuD/methylene tetrahydromethanopterin reductase-like flavin-dependent oxidoreductase (luciferase family)
VIELACSLSVVAVSLEKWAAQREQEGWHALFASDHLCTDVGAAPHMWVVLGAMGASTTSARIGSAFHNNLLRHPVEFAQGALTMQRITDGRFEAGLGAGWSESELVCTGRALPPPGIRAAMLIEAVQIARMLFDDGRCDFDGTHYSVHLEEIERPSVGPPPLVVAAGGRRIIESVLPLVDRLELKVASAATRGGRLDLQALGAITREDVAEKVSLVRSLRADIPIGLHVLCRAGSDERTRRIAATFPPDSLVRRFYGPPEEVASMILSLEELGVELVHVTPGDQQSYLNLAPLLLDPREVGHDRAPGS